jgi:hypothetical protein
MGAIAVKPSFDRASHVIADIHFWMFFKENCDRRSIFQQIFNQINPGYETEWQKISAG